MNRAGSVTYSGVSQKNIEFIGSDIRYIKTGLLALKETNSLFLGSASFLFMAHPPNPAFRGASGILVL